ncbi:hypothetical protein [Mangrovibacterium sp.]|uniref:hypothetical protein n=1 Tax=Mangrovibacterium sp. TaxID=1961364 RepID=UPI00356A9266
MIKLSDLLNEDERNRIAHGDNIRKIDTSKDFEKLTEKELTDLTYILTPAEDINRSSETKVDEISRSILKERAKKIRSRI